MPQFSKGDTFADGQQVTGVRLNGLVDNATALPGLITDQTNLTANTVASGDSVLLHDLSAGALREATAGDLLNSNLPITTSSVSGVSGSDITVTPAAGQKVDVAGNLEADDINITDDATIAGDLTVTGGSTLTGNVIADNGFTSNGTANFTGTLQINGTVSYALYEIFEANVTYSNASVPVGWNAMYTSASFTKPSNEIWVIESDLRWRHTVDIVWAVRINQTTPSTILNATVDIEGAGSNYWHIESNVMRYVFNSGTTFTSTFTIDVMPVSVAGYSFYVGEADYPTAGTALNTAGFPASKFRIYKYRTA